MSLADWQEMVTSLRCEYEQLLYFTIPKLLHLYQNLIAETPSVGSIVNDVGILFQNKHAVKKQLKKTVKVGWECGCRRLPPFPPPPLFLLFLSPSLSLFSPPSSSPSLH